MSISVQESNPYGLTFNKYKIVTATWEAAVNGSFTGIIPDVKGSVFLVTTVPGSPATAALLADAQAKAITDTVIVDAVSANTTLTGAEKEQIIPLVANIVAEHTVLDAKAAAWGITTTRTTYNDTYTALVTTYLGGLSPAWNDTTQSTTIVSANFQAAFDNYYSAREAMLTAMVTAVIPTNLYDIVLNDTHGIDIMGGTLGDRSSTVKEQAVPITGSNFFSRVVPDDLTMVITNNSVAYANGVIHLYVAC